MAGIEYDHVSVEFTTLLPYNDSNATADFVCPTPNRDKPLYRTVGEAIFFGLIILLTMFGNCLVLLSVVKYSYLRRIANIFLVSLAVADLCVGMFIMPFNALNIISGHDWPLGPTFCNIYNANDVMFCTASLLNICCISVDRYIAIVHPFQYPQRMTVRRAFALVFCAWLLSAMISHIPIQTGWYGTPESLKINQNCRVCDFQVNSYYAVASSCTSFWLPTIVMVSVYLIIYREAKRQAKHIKKFSISLGNNQTLAPLDDPDAVNGQGENRRLSRERKDMKREHKAAQTLGVIMGIYLLCWLPFFLWYTITMICQDKCPTPDVLVEVLFWVGYINSALNPVIYARFNKDFKQAFSTLLHCEEMQVRCLTGCPCCIWVRRGSDQEEVNLGRRRSDR